MFGLGYTTTTPGMLSPPSGSGTGARLHPIDVRLPGSELKTTERIAEDKRTDYVAGGVGLVVGIVVAYLATR